METINPDSSAMGTKLRRGDESAFRMFPAQQCFHAADFFGLEVDLGLVVQLKFVAT